VNNCQGGFVPKRKTHHAPDSSGTIRARIERSLRDGRSMQALDLAKNLFRQEPTPANQELLRQAYLARGQELRERGATNDSLSTLKAAAASQGDDPAWLARVARELMLSGGARDALALLPRLADPSARELVMAYAADSAMQQGPAGKALLPEEHHADYDRIVRAFAFGEAGRDEEARTLLGEIGLRSPFLEWKLLLRGLLAYYASEDPRALENWQRLNPERLPARLAAPLRQVIDAPYRTAQPPETQGRLQQQLDKLQGPSLATQMRGLRSALADKENLAPAFRQAEALLPELRRTAPALADRLARVLYWAVMESSPDDVPRYQRVFGRPPADPHFDRLQALAYERVADFARAHKHWQRFEREIAADPARWPDGQATHARALVWLHMGRNAALVPGPEKQARLPWFVREMAGTPRPLKPSAEECFRQATELAPDLLEPYEALLDYYRDAGMDRKAEQAAKRLLKQFPGHAPTLEDLGDLCTDQDEQYEALAFFERALRANPLDRELRAKVVAAHLGCARLRAVDKEIDAAREQIKAALALRGGSPDLTLLCRAAAVELKAGDDARAGELLAMTRHLADSPPAVSFRMMCEVARLKLPKRDKTRFEAEVAAGFAAPPTGATAVGIARELVAVASARKYVGQQTHEKKAISYLEKAKKAGFTEGQLQQTCYSLLELGSVRLLRQYLKIGEEDYPRNPHFPYLQALSYFQQREPDEVPAWRVRQHLEKAEKLARKAPQTDEVQRLLDDVGGRLKVLSAFDPFAALNMFGGPFGFEAGDDDLGGDDDFED
jgi:tetratricopeptide (TPR) repeat protein